MEALASQYPLEAKARDVLELQTARSHVASRFLKLPPIINHSDGEAELKRFRHAMSPVLTTPDREGDTLPRTKLEQVDQRQAAL